MGVAANPLWLNLNVAAGGVKLNGGSSLFGLVRAPAGEVSLEGNTLLQGSVQCDRLALNGNSTLKGTPGALDSIAPARAVQGQTVDVTLRGINTHWVAGQTQASFGGEVSVGGAPQGEPGPVQVIDSTMAIAQVAVSSTAALAPRTVRVVTTIVPPDDVATETLIDGFTVSAATLPGAATAIVSTLAGSAGVPGFVDGPATLARFRDLAGIAVGPDDSIYVADAGNHSIRVVAPGNAPRSAPGSAGILPASPPSITAVSTLAGNGTAGFADGQGAAARFHNPQGIAVDTNGIVYVADTGNNRIRRIAADGTVTTIAGDGAAGFQDGTGAQARFNAPRSIAVDRQGNLYVADTGNAAVRFISVGNVVRTLAGDGTVGSNDSPNARFNGLAGVAIDGDSVFVYLADSGNHRIRRLDQSNTVITIAGAERGFADGSVSQARFADPMGIAVDGAGKLIVVDSTNSLVRFVDPGSAPSSAPGSAGILPASPSFPPASAVSTIAGTGDRGLTDGTGTIARFFTPHGVAVSQSSAIIVADTGNQVLRRILLPPVITALEPFKAKAGESVRVEGERFDGLSPDRNTVRFTNKAGSQSLAQVTTATRTELTVIVPADAATGPVTVATEGGTSNAASFELTNPGPVITSFSPNSGQIGSVVTITGVALKANTGPTVVTFAGTGSIRHEALVTSATATEIKVLVPNGAVSGPIELRNALGSATSTASFTVEPGQEDFQLTIAPSVSSAVQGGTASYVVRVTSPLATFSQLVSLTASGLPPGVTAVFEPSQITSGAQSILSVSLAGTTLPPGSFSFTISGVGMAGGSDVTRTASVTLNVIAAGQTTLTGRVLSTSNEPILGATVSLDSQTTTTDAAGAFLMTGVTAGANRPIKIDGRTATAPNHNFPVIVEPATIVAGQANVVPFIFFLPPIDTDAEVPVVAGENTVAGNARVAGLQMTIPAGANLRHPDGSPVTRVSITPLEPDRTPAPLPPNVGTNLVYTSQPGGAVTDIAIPIVYPNLAGADPGTRVELYAFDHDTASWFIYGFGRVSNDGRSIEPEIDPATGRPFGLKNFSWHFPNVAPDGNPGPDDPCNRGNNPVDFATGIKIEKQTDIEFSGARGGLRLTRIHTSDLGPTCPNCPFGRGTTHNYSLQLTGTFQAGGAGRLVLPGQFRGRLFSYVRTDPDGSLIFATAATVRQLGDTIKKLADGTFEYRDSDARVARFDSQGRLEAITDRNGNSVSFAYTANNLTRVTDAVGRSISLTYDSANRISTVTDPIGRTWQYSYNSSGSLVSVTDPLGGIERFGYDALGRLTSITDKRGIVAKRITYDTNGRVIEQRFADGGVEQYNYALAGTVVASTTMIDPLGRTEIRRFNTSGYLVGRIDAIGQESRTERDITTKLPVKSIGPCGCAEATRQFDSRGNLVAITDRGGNTARLEYGSAQNSLTKITDKRGNSATLAYDSRGNLTSITSALNQTLTFTYDAFGQVTSFADPLGNTTRMEYDAVGNLAARIDPLGNRWPVEHDSVGRITAVTDPLGRRVSFEYDLLNRVVTTADSSRAVTRFTYDENGNRTSVTDALGRTRRIAYDTKNRPIQIADALGRATRLEYDFDDELAKVISPSGRTTTLTYDARGLLESVTDSLGGRVRLAYGSRRNLTALTDKRGNTTTFEYDTQFRLIGRRDPLGRTSSITRDAAGNVTDAVDRLGRHTHITWDPLNRPSEISSADATVRNSYDAGGRLSRIDDSQSGFVEWQYDAAGRATSETTPAGIVSYAYNSAGQRALMTAADRPPVSYQYDVAGRVESIIQGGETFTYGYDVLSRRASLQRPNGVATSYGYDEVGRLTRLTHAKDPASPVEDYRISYNADDEVESIASLASAHLLPAARTVDVADAANRIAQVGDAAFGFDAEGQTAVKTTAGGSTNYQWDARGRLTRASLPNGEAVEYAYDALGRLASRTANGTTTTFLNDGLDVVLDKKSDGSAVDYLNGQFLDEKLRQSQGSAGPLYFLQDTIGSTTALTDATGATVERMRYEPFGSSTGSAFTRYLYTGRELDSLTGLLYYRARWYDPGQGRFISEDPSGLSGGINLYEYAGDQPISRIDPLGLDFIDKFLDRAAQVSAGFGDTISFGFTRKIRQWAGTDGVVDPCSGGYHVGGLLGEGWNVAFLIATAGGGEALEGAGAAAEVTEAAEAAETAEVVAAEAEEAAAIARGGSAPVLKGQQGVERAISELEAEGNEVLAREVTIEAGGGTTRPDLLIRTPENELQFVEVKNGPTARLNPNQRKLFPQIEEFGGVPRGPNANVPGIITPGVPIGPTPVRVIKFP